MGRPKGSKNKNTSVAEVHQTIYIPSNCSHTSEQIKKIELQTGLVLAGFDNDDGGIAIPVFKKV